MSSEFETQFDHPLGEVAYRIARYDNAVDAAIKASVDRDGEWEAVREAIEELLDELRRLDHRIAGKL